MQSYYTASVPNVPGIYLITCTITHKIYVGSAINLRERRKSHFGKLQRNKHPNPKLQNAFNKHGEDAFLFEILELILLPELLTAREQFYLDALKPFGKKGFNIAHVAGSHLGLKRSPEVCKNIGDGKRGKPNGNLGSKFTPERLKQHSLVRIGKKPSPETIRKRAEARKGKKRSPETRKKQSLSAIGHAPTRVRTFIVTSPDGIEYVVQNMAAFAKEHSLASGTLIQVARGKRIHHKKWKARYA